MRVNISNKFWHHFVGPTRAEGREAEVPDRTDFLHSIVSKKEERIKCERQR